MAVYGTNELKNGLKVLVDNAPCNIVDCEFVKPGKGQAFTRIKIRNLLTARVVERTLKSGETLVGADITEVVLQYLYNDGENWHFMEPESFEQYAIHKAILNDAVQWLKEQDTCTAILWNEQPIQVIPANFVVLTITETDPGLRGDTSSGGTKP